MNTGTLGLSDLSKALRERGVIKSVATLRRYEKQGKIKFVRDSFSNHRVLTPEELNRFVELLTPKRAEIVNNLVVETPKKFIKWRNDIYRLEDTPDSGVVAFVFKNGDWVPAFGKSSAKILFEGISTSDPESSDRFENRLNNN